MGLLLNPDKVALLLFVIDMNIIHGDNLIMLLYRLSSSQEKFYNTSINIFNAMSSDFKFQIPTFHHSFSELFFEFIIIHNKIDTICSIPDATDQGLHTSASQESWS